MTARVYDDRACDLGEGPLWHPGRQQLFWFDINGCRLLSRESGTQRVWRFDEHASAAGWVDDDHLLIATETRLLRLDLETDRREDVVALEANTDATRSNDGRADPWGGFWIGTMGKQAEPGLGAIYRYYRGDLRRLFDGITISNAICFSPDRRWAYYTDTPTQIILRQALRPDHGWPSGAPEPWIDLRAENWRPDGAVCDAAGNLWNAQWGGWRVACYGPDGAFRRAVDFPAAHTSCPAFGGSEFSTLFCTSALEGITPDLAARSDAHGKTFAADVDVQGQAEHQVVP